jgi:PhoH-like ATPase
VLDSNVLLDRPVEDVIYSFSTPCKIVIPLAVISELDNFKGYEDARGLRARQAIRFLDNLRPNLCQGVMLESGHFIMVELNHVDVELPHYLPRDKVDNRILAICKGIQQEQTKEVTLVTQDICQRIIADVLGIKSINYVVEDINVDNMYTGTLEIAINDSQLQNLYQFGNIDIDHTLLPNQYVLMTDNAGGLHYGRYQSNLGIVPINKGLHSFGITPAPNNPEQVFLMDALLDPKIELVTALGTAGTGKTLLALATGLHQVINLRRYNKLIVSRALIPHDRDLGALPGDKTEKLTPWMDAIFDNLEFLTHNFSINKYDDRTASPAEKVGKFMEEGYIELEALTYIRGRSIPQQWIIIDEAQNLTKENVKTIITRAGIGTKIIMTGDIQQIDNYRLTAKNNGFVTLIEAFKGQNTYAHITLSKTERSYLASLGVSLLP